MFSAIFWILSADLKESITVAHVCFAIRIEERNGIFDFGHLNYNL